MEIQNSDNIDSDNDERIMESIRDDGFAAGVDDSDIANQSTLQLLIKQLKLNIVELKVAQKLQNTNLLLHIDQLKKKYSALKLDVDNLKAEKLIKKTDTYQQTDETSKISKSVQVNNLDSNSFNSNDCMIVESTTNSRISTSNLTNELQSSEASEKTFLNQNVREEIEKNGREIVTKSPTVNNTSLPKIVSVAGKDGNNENSVRNRLTAESSRASKEIINTATPPVVNNADISGNVSSMDQLQQDTDIMEIDTDLTDEMLRVFDHEMKVEKEVEEDDEIMSQRTEEDSVESSICSAILSYIENQTGRKIIIISYGNISQNEWVILSKRNSEDENHTIVLCITFYDEYLFSVSTAKRGKKGNSGEEKFYSVVYRFAPEDAIEVPIETELNQIQNLQKENVGPSPKTNETISTADSSNEVVTHQEFTSDAVSAPNNSTFVTEAVVHTPHVPQVIRTPNRSINDSSSTLDINSASSQKNNLLSVTESTNASSRKNHSGYRLDETSLKNLVAKNLKQSISNKLKSLREAGVSFHTNANNVSDYRRHPIPEVVYFRNDQTPKPLGDSRNHQTPNPLNDSFNRNQIPNPLNDSFNRNQALNSLSDSRNQTPQSVSDFRNHQTPKPHSDSRNHQTPNPLNDSFNRNQTPNLLNDSRNNQTTRPFSNSSNQSILDRIDSTYTESVGDSRNHQTTNRLNDSRNHLTPKPLNDSRNQTPKSLGDSRNHQTPSNSSNQNILDIIDSTYTESESLISRFASVSHLQKPTKNWKKKDNPKNIITVEDRRPNKRNARTTKTKYRNKYKYNKTCHKMNSNQLFQSLMKSSCDSSPSPKKQRLNQFVRTEKKQLSSLPTVTIREHVSLEADEEEQVLPLVDDDVFIVEVENKPIEID